MPAGGGAAVEVRSATAASCTCAGKADRVDRRADGDLVVIDYKTGSEASYKALSHDDPVTAGTHLQLPVYAYAARAAFGATATDVEAYYWFVGRARTGASATTSTPRSTTCSPTRCGRSSTASKAACSRSGRTSPRRRRSSRCDYCDPDGMGTTDRWREWERKFAAPELAGFRSLSASEPKAEVTERFDGFG